MALLQAEDYDDLFRTFSHTAFHIELKDTYSTPEEAGPFNLFLQGQPDDFAWHEPWLRLVREATRAGKSMTRVRLVSVPPSDYARWGMAIAPLNIEAGEDIRWLPRELATDIVFPPDDFWLFDDDRVILTVFADNGQFLGGTEVSDSATVAQCREVQQKTWERAILHSKYVSSSYVTN